MVYIYTFRLLSDKDEEFYRDIEIKSSNNFLEMHRIIQKSLGIEGSELASIFLTNTEWEKQKEFTLMDMMEDMQDALDPGHIPVFVMEKETLKDHIEDPHQRLLYEYDFLNPQSFFLELTHVNKGAQHGKKYPRIAASQGDVTHLKTNNFDWHSETIEFLRDPDAESDIEDVDNFLKDHFGDLFNPDPSK